MRLARTLCLCVWMHISCIVLFEYRVRSPSILFLFTYSTPFMCVWIFPCTLNWDGSQHICRLACVHVFPFFFWLAHIRVSCARRSVWQCRWSVCSPERWPSQSAMLNPFCPRPLPSRTQPVGANARTASPLLQTPPPRSRSFHHPLAPPSLDIKRLTLAFKQGQAKSSCQSHKLNIEVGGFGVVLETGGGVKRTGLRNNAEISH